MLKIYFNEKSDSEHKLKIIIKDLCVAAEVIAKYPAGYGKDAIETLRPYNSYTLVSSSGKVKNYRKMSKSDFKFLDLNRLGVSVKLDFAELLQLYGTADILQLDTGIIGGTERDITIRVFEGKKENTEIVALVRSTKMNTSELSAFLKAYREKNDTSFFNQKQEEINHEEN